MSVLYVSQMPFVSRAGTNRGFAENDDEFEF